MRPNNNAPCANCEHAFYKHYETYMGNAYGCSQHLSHRTNFTTCRCKGFMVFWTAQFEALMLPEGETT